MHIQDVSVAGLRDEGVIKFSSNWDESEPFSYGICKDLLDCRNSLYQSGLIGQYSDGVAYGNISKRIVGNNQFYITGSATGGIPLIDERHVARVDSVDIQSNRLSCSGPVVASSESMTHAVLYECGQDINAVIHVHHADMWKRLMNKAPTINADISYGTPEMADAVIELYQNSSLSSDRIFITAGHEDGVFVFGPSLHAANETLMSTYRG